MTKEPGHDRLLSPYRVLDLTDETGFLCGKILADMGADVLKVERPGGDPGRRIGPYYHDQPSPEKSLYWAAYNTNKRGITLDIETATGQNLFRKLVERADVVIESFEPGFMDRLGLGYAELEGLNRGLVMVSITPFGQTGPFVDQGYRASDMVLWAMSGFMFPNGDPDRPPNQLSFPQAFLHGGAEAAVAALTALYARDATGEGEHVDVSILQSIHTSTQLMMPTWDMYGEVIPRGSTRRGIRKPDGSVIHIRSTYECADGLFHVTIGGGSLKSFALSSKALVEWMDEEGMAGDLVGYDWSQFNYLSLTQADLDHMQEEIIGPFIKKHTKADLYSGCIARKILGCPYQDPRDVAESPQLAARNFFVRVEHPELNDTLTYCGPFIQLSETPLNDWHRAPLIGEHNVQVYRHELGLSSEQLSSLRQANVI